MSPDHQCLHNDSQLRNVCNYKGIHPLPRYWTMSPIPVRGSVLLSRITNHCWNTVSQILILTDRSASFKLCVTACGAVFPPAASLIFFSVSASFSCAWIWARNSYREPSIVSVVQDFNVCFLTVHHSEFFKKKLSKADTCILRQLSAYWRRTSSMMVEVKASPTRM